MKEQKIQEEIYELVIGAVKKSNRYPEVESVFDDENGSECSNLYGEIYDLKVRLSERLGKPGDEDPDVETIINNMFDICRIVGERMFLYGRTMKE